jgi:hypothetical protein
MIYSIFDQLKKNIIIIKIQKKHYLNIIISINFFCSTVNFKFIMYSKAKLFFGVSCAISSLIIYKVHEYQQSEREV